MDIQEQRLKHLRDLGFNPKFILDVGACIAEWAKMAKNIFPNSELLLFEANDKNEQTLLTSGFPYRISLLGDKKEEVEYFAIKEKPGVYNTGNSIFKEKTSHFTGDNYETKQLKMTTLDSELETHWVEGPDFLKMDVQGAELMVLDGATKALETVEVILLETQLIEFNEGAPMFSEVNNKLDALGFQLLDILGYHYMPDGTLMQLDALYVKKDSPYIKRGLL